MGIAIRVSDVTKIYQRYSYRKQFRTLKSAILGGSLVKELSPDQSFTALDGVTFNVRQGSTFAVIGRNGSGKSTLLKLMAGISKPTTGSVEVHGRISALIELGAGFHPEITGRENVFINGIMLGLTKKEIRDRFDEIVEFAELEDFIDAPVKTYSSGMYMRLGFAVAIHVNPDVLLIDEVLAVGDEAFVHKCLDKISEFRRRDKTILLVTHSLGLVEKMADEALWVDSGRIQMRGDPKKVVDAYLSQVAEREEEALTAAEAQAVARFAVKDDSASAPDGDGIPARGSLPESKPKPSSDQAGSDGAVQSRGGARDDDNDDPDDEANEGVEPHSAFKREKGRWGSREVEISNVAILDHEGESRHVFQLGEPVTVQLTIKSTGRIKDFVFGVAIFNADGVCCYGTNTHIEEFVPVELSGEGSVKLHLDRLALIEGSYFMDVAAHQRDGYPFDYHRALHQFRVNSRIKDLGIYRPIHEWEFSPNIVMESPDPEA